MMRRSKIKRSGKPLKTGDYGTLGVAGIPCLVLAPRVCCQRRTISQKSWETGEIYAILYLEKYLKKYRR